MSSKLESYLEKAAGDLPTMSTVATQVMKAVEDPDGSMADVRKLIEQDAAIASRILKVANSALYGFRSEIQSLGHALSLLGLRTVRDLVLGVTMKGTYSRFGLMEKLLWEHSAMAGPVTEALSRQPQISFGREDAFTAGLMHDIGKTALANSHRDEYEQVIARVYNEQVSFVEAERDFFGFDHAELGARVAERWGLPPKLVAVIEHHHSPGRLAELDEGVARLTALVAISTACLTRLGVGRREPVPELDLAQHPAWTFLGLGEDLVEPFLVVCQEQVAAGQSMLE